MRRLALVTTLLLGGLAAAYGALVLLDLLARDEVRTSRPLTLPARGALMLDTGAEDVTVEAAAGAPRLEARARRGVFGGGDVRIVQAAGGRVSVKTDCGFPRTVLACGGSLRVLVPPGTAVEIDAGSGDIDVRGIRARVFADTGSGDIRVDDVAGPELRLDTGSGDVAGAGVRAARLQAKTGSGNIELTADGAPDDVFVDTGSGDVEMTVPDEVYDVGAESGSGDQEVTVRSDSASARRLRVKTGSGDVTVRPAR